MAPGITYTNVPNTETQDGSTQGKLFDGYIFWIGRQVPMRAHWAELVKDNGGEVVNDERRANMLIGDDARKNQPVGSYSWKFIEKSVEEGVVQIKDKYLIGGGVDAPSRPTGSTQPQKKTRTQFTTKDDQILAAWVKAFAQRGFKRKGNQVYQALARVYPNHTWQSWQSRWNDKVSHLPDDALDMLEQAGAEEVTDQKVADGMNISAPKLQEPRASRVSPIDDSPPPPASPRRRPVTGRVPFTEEDDIDLMNYREKGFEDSTPISQVYQMLATNLPHHTAQSWRARWEKTLRNRVENGGLSQYRASLSPRRRIAQAQRLSGQVGSASRLRAVPEAEEGADQEDEDEDGDVEEDSARVGEAANHADAGQDGQSDEVRLSPIRPTLVTGESDRESDHPASPVVSPRIPARRKSLKEQFYEDWANYWTLLDREMPVLPPLADKAIDLWDLYHVATSFEPDDRDWNMVAQSLGLDLTAHPDVPQDLQTWYHDHMAFFEDARAAAVDDSSDEDSSDDEAEDLASVASRQASIVLDVMKKSSPLKASPPRALKRTASLAQVLSDLPFAPSTKRMRYARDEEVPSTPDTRLGIQRSLRAQQSTKKGDVLSSPTRHRTNGNSQALPAMPQADTRPRFEPETQDFRFDPDTQMQSVEDDVLDDHLDLDPSPSQQLISEAVARSPVSPSLARRLLIEEAETVQPMSEKARGKQPVRKTEVTQPARSTPRQHSPLARSSLSTSLALKKTAKRVEFSSPLASKEPPTARKVDRGASPSVRAPSALKLNKEPLSRTASTPAQKPAATTPRATSSGKKRGARDVNETIQHFVSLGIAEDVVITSLLAANMEISLACVVMEHLSTGRGVPENREGIWTAKDDQRLEVVHTFDFDHVPMTNEEKLERKDAVKFRERLEYKHGQLRMEQRREFLAKGRAGG